MQVNNFGVTPPVFPEPSAPPPPYSSIVVVTPLTPSQPSPPLNDRATNIAPLINQIKETLTNEIASNQQIITRESLKVFGSALLFVAVTALVVTCIAYGAAFHYLAYFLPGTMAGPFAMFGAGFMLRYVYDDSRLSIRIANRDAKQDILKQINIKNAEDGRSLISFIYRCVKEADFKHSLPLATLEDLATLHGRVFKQSGQNIDELNRCHRNIVAQLKNLSAQFEAEEKNRIALENLRNQLSNTTLT